MQVDELTDAEVDAQARTTYGRWLARGAHRAASQEARSSTSPATSFAGRGPGPAREDVDEGC